MDFHTAPKKTMMTNLGSKKRENASRTERYTDDLPKLSNEMQLSIMNKVKNGELSIEDALDQARRDRDQLLQQRSLDEEEQKPSQYNFSVHKHGRYRWQKRVLQIDFNTKMLCSIEKGIIKRQLPFSIVKSCDDGVGSRFSISFRGHHDYELEATSLEDKHKMMQLVNQVIYRNIYSDHEEGAAEAQQQPQASRSLRDGVLLLHRGGLASLRWVKYEVQLHPGQLTLVPLRCRGPAEGEVVPAVSTVIHLSDGDTSVRKPPSPDAFTLITHKNEYKFKVPVSDETGARGTVQKERDAWVSAIDRLCVDWKRRSMGEHTFVETAILRNISIAEDAEGTEDPEDPEDPEDADTDVQSGTCPPVDKPTEDLTSSSGDPSSDVPEPCITGKAAAPFIGPDTSPHVPSPTSPRDAPLSPPASPQPPHTPLSPCPPGQESQGPDVKAPSPLSIPAPPPLPFRIKFPLKKHRTKAFHWDLVGPDKIAKSLWVRGATGRIEINTSLLREQFAVKDVGGFEAAEHSNAHQHIMLNQKIAHNFNIFLKSFPVQPGELKDKLFIVNEKDGGLSDGHITSLRRYVPTVDDVEMYKSHKGPVTELHIVDQYMLEMCNIPYLSKQLDLLLTLRELPTSMSDLQPLINQKIQMCMQLCHGRSFVSVLEYVLAIGNYLNENAGKEKAKGFRLSSLSKLSQLRGRDKRFTLLHALVEQIMLHEPGLATFTQDLTEFETVPGASIKGLTAEVDVLKNELQKVVQYRKTSRKRNAETHHPQFSKDLKSAIETYDSTLAALTKTCEEMKKLYSVILVKFGEPADRDSQELFGLVCQFLHDFKRAHAEVS